MKLIRKDVITRVLFLSVILVLCGLLVIQRYRSGINYLGVHIRISEPQSIGPAELRVFTQSPFGTYRELSHDLTDRGLFRAPFATPVSSILLATNGNVEPDAFTCAVRCGQFWAAPSRDMVIDRMELIGSGEILEERFGRLIRVHVRPLSGSFLKTAGTTMNWQGDFQLFFVPLMQATILAGFCIASMVLVRRLARAKAESPSSHFGPLFQFDAISIGCRLFLGFFWVCGFIVVGHQAILQLPRLSWANDTLQFLVAVFCTIAVVGSSLLLAWWSGRRQTTRSIDFVAIMVLCGILLLKVAWIFSVDTFQLGDYGLYWHNAQTMANGDWKSMSGASTLQSILTTRAFPYFYPLASMLGSSNTAIELGNLLIQSLTLLLAYLFARSAMGARVALSSLPLIAANPDYWFGVSLATHDVPAMFLLIMLFFLIETIRVRLIDKAVSVRGVAGLWWLVAIAILIGVVGGILDVQRSYWPFVVCSISSAVVVSVYFLWTRGNLSRSAHILASTRLIGLACVAVVSVFITAASIRSYVAKQIGPTGSLSTLATLASYGSNTSAKWNDQAPWTDLYTPAIPVAEQTSVMLRKLMYEKIFSGPIFWMHLYRKNVELAGTDFTMLHAHGGSEESYFPRVELITWYETKQLFCNGYSLVLFSLFLIRMVLLSKLPFMPGEIYPLIFSATAYAILLLLTQAVAVYDMFFGFTLAWSASIVFCRIVQPVVAVAEPVGLKVKGYLKSGLAVVAVSGGLHLLVAVIMAYAWRPYFSPRAVPFSVSADRNYLVPEIDMDDVTASVAFPRTMSGPVSSGRWTGAEIDLGGLRSRGEGIRFFVSLDQRRRKQAEKDSWVSLPVAYSVEIDGEVVDAGPISSLAQPHFVHYLPALPAKSAKLEMSMSFEKSETFSEQSQLPVLAIEYLN